MRKTVMRWLPLLLALVLALGMLPAAAEEAASEPAAAPEPAVVNWEDVAPDLEAWGLEGALYTLKDVDIAFWVPSFLPPSESEENYEDTNVIAAFHTAGTGRGFFISFYALDVADTGALAAVMERMGASDIRILRINGLDACSFEFDDILHVTFLAEGGNVLSFDFYDASDYVFSAVARFIAASVQPYTK